MTWPSYLLFMSIPALLLALAGAAVLQFNSHPPRGSLPAVVVAFCLGIATVSIYAVQARVAEDPDKRPSLLSILLP